MSKPILEILTLAFIFTIISVYREHTDVLTVDHLPSTPKYVATLFMRFIHYIIVCFSVGFLLFFRTGTAFGSGGKTRTEFWMRAELILILMITFGWWLLECCWISYVEIMLYDVDVHTYKSTTNPTFIELFSPYESQVSNFFGIMYLVNVAILTYKISAPIAAKLLYLLAFATFFTIGGILPALVETPNYPKDNFIMSRIQAIYDKFFR
jgi:hypothetical protein